MAILGTGSAHQAGRYRQKTSWKPYRREGVAGKDEPTCQKCLQRGHWTFQCTNETAYATQPTRTKQLTDQKKRRKFLDPSEIPEEFKEKKARLKDRNSISDSGKSSSYTSSTDRSNTSSYTSSTDRSNTSSYTSSTDRSNTSSYTSSSDGKRSRSGASSSASSDFDTNSDDSR